MPSSALFSLAYGKCLLNGCTHLHPALSRACLAPPGPAGMAAQRMRDLCASLGPLHGTGLSLFRAAIPLVSPQKSYKVGEVSMDSPRSQHQQLGT